LQIIVAQLLASVILGVIPARVSGAREESRISRMGRAKKTGILRAAAPRENDRASIQPEPHCHYIVQLSIDKMGAQQVEDHGQ
jgi:hypothetical protein